MLPGCLPDILRSGEALAKFAGASLRDWKEPRYLRRVDNMTIVGNPVASSTLDWGLMTYDGINGRGKPRHQLPAGLFAVKSTSLIPAEREIAIDTMAEWLALARGSAPKRSITRTRISMSVCSTCRTVGVDAVIEAVGMESHGAGRLMGKNEIEAPASSLLTPCGKRSLHVVQAASSYCLACSLGRPSRRPLVHSSAKPSR